MFLFDGDDIASLVEGVQSGDATACYALARYHCTVRPEANSLELAIELLHRAADAGVADATAALALLWRSGDMGLLDYEKYQQMITEAYEKGSLLAAKEVLTDMIYGYGVERDINRAMAIIDERLAQDDRPLWFYLKALAVHNSANMLDWEDVCPKAAEWYRKAIDGGVHDAYDGLLEVCSKDYFSEIVDTDRYIDIACEGAAAGYCRMMNAVAEYEYDIYYSNPENQSEDWYRQMREDFESALNRGCADAAYYLGLICYKEENDLDTAWAYYTKGAILGSSKCYEAMYDLMDQGAIKESERFKMQTALYGTRCGSQRLVKVVGELYKAGHLQTFAPEIENYYIPRLHRLEEFERGEITI